MSEITWCLVADSAEISKLRISKDGSMINLDANEMATVLKLICAVGDFDDNIGQD